jgi:hypothetical protein
MKDSVPNVRNRFYRGLNKLRQIIGVQRTPSGYISVRAE